MSRVGLRVWNRAVSSMHALHMGLKLNHPSPAASESTQILRDMRIRKALAVQMQGVRSRCRHQFDGMAVSQATMAGRVVWMTVWLAVAEVAKTSL